MATKTILKKKNTKGLSLKAFTSKELKEVCVNGLIQTPKQECGLGGLIRLVPHKIKKSVHKRINVMVPKYNYAGKFIVKGEEEETTSPINIQYIADQLEAKRIPINDCKMVDISGPDAPLFCGLMTMNCVSRIKFEDALNINPCNIANESNEIYVVFDK